MATNAPSAYHSTSSETTHLMTTLSSRPIWRHQTSSNRGNHPVRPPAPRPAAWERSFLPQTASPGALPRGSILCNTVQVPGRHHSPHSAAQLRPGEACSTLALCGGGTRRPDRHAQRILRRRPRGAAALARAPGRECTFCTLFVVAIADSAGGPGKEPGAPRAHHPRRRPRLP